MENGARFYSFLVAEKGKSFHSMYSRAPSGAIFALKISEKHIAFE